MLRSFRQVFKSNRTPMAAVMIIVLLGLVAYLAPTGGAVSSDTVGGRVYGHEVLMRELAEHMQELYQRYGKQASPEALKPFIQSQALRDLMNQKLMEDLAERHHVVVTDEEVGTRLRAFLRQYPVLLDANGNLKSNAELARPHGLSSRVARGRAAWSSRRAWRRRVRTVAAGISSALAASSEESPSSSRSTKIARFFSLRPARARSKIAASSWWLALRSGSLPARAVTTCASVCSMRRNRLAPRPWREAGRERRGV